VIVTARKAGIPAWSPRCSRLKKNSRGLPCHSLEPGGIGTGSGRSIGGVDLGKAVRQAVHDGFC